MWSGPRNISTAMMYAFAARNDCAVVDEPFYAAYLNATGIDHPMRREILAAGEIDPGIVIQNCLGPISENKAVSYQKHMTQHMVHGFDRTWIKNCTNVFLIRDPDRVIASYAAKRENPTLDDIGFRQQAELFDDVCQAMGKAPPVLDSTKIREGPKAALENLCNAIGLNFQSSMLCWPTGGHKNDGIWAKHWYGAVWASNGFAGPESDLPIVPYEQRKVAEQARTFYEKIAEHAL